MSAKIKLGDWAKFYGISTRQVIRWRDDYLAAIPGLEECPLESPTKMISLWPQVYKREVSAALKETETSGRIPPQGSVKVSSPGKTSAPSPTAAAPQKFDFSSIAPGDRFDFRDAVNSAEQNGLRWKQVLDKAAADGDMTAYRAAQGAYNDALESLRKTKLAAAKIAESEGTSVSREIVATELRRIHGGIPKSLRTTIFEELLVIIQMSVLPTRDQLREIVASAVDKACIRLRDSKFEFENVA